MLPLLALSAVTADAQDRSTLLWLDAGGARVQQPTSTLRSAGSVGGGVWHGRGRIAVAAEGSVTTASDSVNAAQYIARATFAPSAAWRTDFDVSATTNGFALPTSNGNRAVAVRQAFTVRAIELSVFGGAGNTSRLDIRTQGQRVGGALAWQRTTSLGTWRTGAQLAHSWTDDFKLMEASKIFLREVAPAYTVLDRQFDASWQRGRLWVQASRSWRAGRDRTIGSATGFHLAGALRLTDATMLIVQGGEQLADVVRGVPQARYTGVAMRWNPVRPRALRRDPRRLGDDRGGIGEVTAVPELKGDEVLLQRSAGSGALTLTITAPADAVVEVATSATDWVPMRVAHDRTAFVHRLTLPSGAHKVAVRINGGPWRAPLGLAAVDDDFGGRAGVVVVP